MKYNVDGLFYDVRNNEFISFTYNNFIENGLKKINNDNNIENGRVKKLELYSKQIS